jgi:hypothetical protein
LAALQGVSASTGRRCAPSRAQARGGERTAVQVGSIL